MPLTVGGGVRTVEDIRTLLLAGADKVSINTAAVHRPRLRARGGREVRRPVHRRRHRRQAGVGARRAADWEIFTHGGRNPTGLDAVDYAEEVVSLGAGEILLTSMDRDGTKAGFDVALTRAVADAVPVPVIASGGVGTLDHLVDGVRDGHATAVLAASIFHFGELTIREAKTRWPRPACRCGSIREAAMSGDGMADMTARFTLDDLDAHRGRARPRRPRPVLHRQAAGEGHGRGGQEARRGGASRRRSPRWPADASA